MIAIDLGGGMATNIYDSVQHVYYREEPTKYFGWHISFNWGGLDVHHFNTLESKNQYLEQAAAVIQKRLPSLDSQAKAHMQDVPPLVVASIEHEDLDLAQELERVCRAARPSAGPPLDVGALNEAVDEMRELAEQLRFNAGRPD